MQSFFKHFGSPNLVLHILCVQIYVPTVFVMVIVPGCIQSSEQVMDIGRTKGRFTSQKEYLSSPETLLLQQMPYIGHEYFETIVNLIKHARHLKF